jgi:hypothetical protein
VVVRLGTNEQEMAMTTRQGLPTTDAVPRPVEILRIGVGITWLAGAVWNLLVTRHMADPFGWLADGSWVAPWRRFFGGVVAAHRSFWTTLLIVGETALGVLTLARNGWARSGLIGGAVFSATLFSLGTSYTLMMGPYALLLAKLARHEFRRSIVDLLQGHY